MPRGGRQPGAGRPPSLNRETVTTSVELYRDQRDALRALARERGVSASEIVRGLVGEMLQQRDGESTH